MSEPVSKHMERQGLEFLQFAFRWFNCLLIREVRGWEHIFPFVLNVFIILGGLHTHHGQGTCKGAWKVSTLR